MNLNQMLRLVIGVCLTTVSLLAQSTAVSQISGIVRDTGGLGVPDARITVTQASTGLTRSVQTGNQGDYTMPGLPIGPYKISVTKEGF